MRWWATFGAMLLLAGCVAKKTPGVKVDASLDTLVPADTVLLVGTRLESLLKTPIYQKNFANRQFPQIDEFARRTGIDPRKDLWELLFVSNGKQGVLLGRGKLADEMMEPKLDSDGARRFGYKGFKLMGNDREAVLFVNSTTAALGETSALYSLIDQRGTSRGPPAPLTELMKEIPPDAQFWSAYTGGSIKLPIDPSSNLANVNNLLGSIQNGSIYFDLRNGLNGVGSATCATDDGAQQVHDALKALIGIGRLSAPKDQPELAQVYDGLRVTQEGHRVKLYIDVAPDMVDKFLGVWLGNRR